MTQPRVIVLDYGSGNLRSAERALARVGATVVVTDDTEAARECDGLVVPGVGAFAACMDGIRRVGGDVAVKQRLADDRPVLGICVGMQVLYDAGREHGVESTGIGVLTGRVDRLDADVLPHMGWNTVTPAAGSALFAGVERERFYFVHSYGVAADGSDGESVAQHGRSTFVAGVEQAVLSATQFHPEKSGDAGLHLLANWVRTLT